MYLRKGAIFSWSESKQIKTSWLLMSEHSLRRASRFLGTRRRLRNSENVLTHKGLWMWAGFLGSTSVPAYFSLFPVWSAEGDSRLLREAAGKPVVLAEPPGEGDGSAQGGGPGPVGLSRLHRADPNPHLRALAAVHPVQGVCASPRGAEPQGCARCSRDAGELVRRNF